MEKETGSASPWSSLSWPQADKALLLAILLLTAVSAHLGYLTDTGDRIRGSDSIGYYVYLPSIFMDGDISFADDFQRLGGKDVFLFPAPDGRAGNPYSIGPALLWMPWFALGHVGAWLADQPMDGFSPPYQFCVYWGNVLYVVLGLLLTLRLLRSFDVSPIAALVTVLSVLLATQLTYYLFPKSATSHGLSFATVAAFALSLRTHGLGWQSGLLGGLIALVRWQNILIVPIAAAAFHITREGRRLDTAHLKAYAPFLVAAFAGILPQLIFWQILYGQPFTVPQLPGYVDLTRLPILKVLFSLRHGLITWHPWWLFALAGIVALHRRSRPWAIAIAAIFVVQLYLNGTVRDWWGTWSFGHRRFVNLLPMLAIPIAVLLDRLSLRQIKLAAAGLVLFAVWNQAFIFQYQNALIPRSNAPTVREFIHDKFKLRTVWLTQLAVNTAVQSFRVNDFENFLRFAGEAHKLYPEYRNTAKVYSVASAVEDRKHDAIESYGRWLEIEPDSKAARWGLADVRLRMGEVGLARTLMEPLGVSDPQVLEVLQSGQGTLMTPSFFEQYRQELNLIYSE